MTTADWTSTTGVELSAARSLPDPFRPAEHVATAGWRLSDLLLPALTVRASALEHNVALHARWCAAEGVSQAPHAKTHLSPEIVRLQLASGAWGMTAATVHQVRFLATLGVRRVILAHQVVDAASIRALAGVLDAHPDLVVMPLVDSVAGVAALTRHWPAGTRSGLLLPVLVELGLGGGRTGIRADGPLTAVAEAVRSSPVLRLAGVEGFEGILTPSREPADVAQVDAFLQRLGQAAETLDADGLFDGTDEILVTAGGSVFPDRVAALSIRELSRPVRVVVRSGSTVTHDHGEYARSAPLAPEARHPLGALRPALDLWAAVVSVPEPGLALLGMGKRDAPFDSGMPVTLAVRRAGDVVDVAAIVERMNDQHAFVSHDGLEVGDVVQLGPRHPCTTFDRWRTIPVLDDGGLIIGAITTWF